MRELGIMNPILRVSVCGSRRQHSGQKSCQHLARKDLWSQVGSGADKILSPSGQSLQRLLPRDQRGMEQHFGAWSSAVSAVLWSLPQLYLESGVLHPSGSLAKCLGTPDDNWGICPGAYGWYMAVLLGILDGKCGISPGPYVWVVLLCRRGYSGHTCRYLRCVFLPDVSSVT